jgi:hypothetical protein
MVVAALVFIVLGACVKVELEDHSLQFNEAAGSLGLRLLLLNSVRASKDYPLQFSALSSYTGTGSVAGSLSVNGPFRGFPVTSDLNPKIDVKNGVSQMSLADLSNAEAQNALKRQVTVDTYRHYYTFAGRRSLGVINAVMIERIEVNKGWYLRISKFAEKYCAASPDPEYLYACLYRNELKAACTSQWLDVEKLRIVNVPVRISGAPSASRPEGQQEKRRPSSPLQVRSERVQTPYLLFVSSAASECAFHHLTFVGLNLYIAGINVEEDACTDPKLEAAQQKIAAPGATVNIYTGEQKSPEAKKTRYQFSFTNKHFLDDLSFSEQEFIRTAEPCRADLSRPIEITFRSPERMVRFIGELIAAQNYSPRPFVPRSMDLATGAKFNMLRVVRGTPSPGAASVSVKDPDGEIFYVPKPNYGAQDRDRSLELLSIVGDVVNSAISKNAFPQVTTFTLAPG